MLLKVTRYLIIYYHCVNILYILYVCVCVYLRVVTLGSGLLSVIAGQSDHSDAGLTLCVSAAEVFLTIKIWMFVTLLIASDLEGDAQPSEETQGS